MRTLDFTKNKVETLTLQELEQSYHENHVTGQPVNGMYHYVLIQQVLEIFANHGLRPEVQEIFAANNRESQRPGVTVLPMVEERDGKGAVSAHLLRRVYANIALRIDESDEMVTNVAVAYHQKGIQIAIGPMVKVCHNQCITGRPDVVANYGCFNGDGKLHGEQRTVDHLLNTAAAWAMAYEEQSIGRMKICNNMANRLFTRDDLYRVVGVLTEKRILHDTSVAKLHQPDIYPLNNAQINEACEKLLTDVNTDREMTWWDAYQHMNGVLKPDRMDIPSLLPQSVALIETMKELATERN